MTIYERALEFVPDGAAIGLGSGRAAAAFIQLLGERVKAGLHVRAVPTSRASADLATRNGIPARFSRRSHAADRHRGRRR